MDCAAWEVFEDSIPALSLLREQGWRHAVLSNHVPELEELVGDLGLGSVIDVVVSSANTGYEKPHTMAYRSVLKVLGEVSRVWMVGDNPIADVVGAEKLGIPGILVRSPEWTEEYLKFVTDSWGRTNWRDWQKKVTRKVSDLSEAAEIIEAAELR